MEQLSVSGHTLRAKPSKISGNLALSFDDGATVDTLRLPQNGTIRAVQLSRWGNKGIAMCLVQQQSRGEFAYYWATARCEHGRIDSIVLDEFYRSKAYYSIAGVLNTSGDSICITVLQHGRNGDKDKVEGFVSGHASIGKNDQR